MVERENVKFLKLVNGEEVVAEVQDAGDCWILKNPVVISLREMGNGKVGLSMPAWLNLSAQEEFSVAKIHVITTGVPFEDLVEGYIQAHNKIVVPPAGKLII